MEDFIDHLTRSSPISPKKKSDDPLEVRQSRKDSYFQFIRPELDGLFDALKFKLGQQNNVNELTISYRGGIPKGFCPPFCAFTTSRGTAPKDDEIERSLRIVVHRLSQIQNDIIEASEIERDELGDLLISKDDDMDLSVTEPTTGVNTAHSSSHN